MAGNADIQLDSDQMVLSISSEDEYDVEHMESSSDSDGNQMVTRAASGRRFQALRRLPMDERPRSMVTREGLTIRVSGRGPIRGPNGGVRKRHHNRPPARLVRSGASGLGPVTAQELQHMPSVVAPAMDPRGAAFVAEAGGGATDGINDFLRDYSVDCGFQEVLDNILDNSGNSDDNPAYDPVDMPASWLWSPTSVADTSQFDDFSLAEMFSLLE